MAYPIIVPSYYQELKETNTSEEDVGYNVYASPYSVEYTFPICQRRLLKKLMECKDPLSFKMTNLKPEDEKEFEDKAKGLVDEYPQLKYYWNIKVLTMNALQDRNYVFEKRMLLLNYIYKTLDNIMIKAENEDEKESLLDRFSNDYLKNINHDEVIKLFESIKPNFAYSLYDGLSLLRSMPSSEEYDKVLDKVFSHFGNDHTMDDFKFDREKYLPMKRDYYEVFLKDKEHYIEQVMVNYAWTYCMPYVDCTSSLWDNFIFFNTLFNAIKVLLTCVTYNAQDKDEEFINAIIQFDLALRRVKGSLVKTIALANAKEGLSNNGDMAILAMS